MQSNHINTAARFTGLIAALLLLGGVAGIARADGAKGGATLLMPPAPVAPPSDYKPMSCGMCKSEWTTRAEVTTKGTTPVTALVEKHLCSGCATKIETAGFGKAKHDVATHKCTSCGAELASCCSTSKGGITATKGMEKTFEVAPVK